MAGAVFVVTGLLMALDREAILPFNPFVIPLGLLVAYVVAKILAFRLVSKRIIEVREPLTAGRFEEVRRAIQGLSAAKGIAPRLVGKRVIPRAVMELEIILALRSGDQAGFLKRVLTRYQLRDLFAGYEQAAGLGMAGFWALKGDLDAADRWLALSRSRELTLFHLVLLARRGECGKVVTSAPLVLQLSRDDAHAIRATHLLVALCLKGRGAEAEVVDEHLERARPAYAGEYDYLTGSWPELMQLA